MAFTPPHATRRFRLRPARRPHRPAAGQPAGFRPHAAGGAGPAPGRPDRGRPARAAPGRRHPSAERHSGDQRPPEGDPPSRREPAGLRGDPTSPSVPQPLDRLHEARQAPGGGRPRRLRRDPGPRLSAGPAGRHHHREGGGRRTDPVLRSHGPGPRRRHRRARRHAPAALYRRQAGRGRAGPRRLPDGLCPGRRLGGRPHGRPALHARADGAAAGDGRGHRIRHPARRGRDLPAGEDRRPDRSQDARRIW